MMPTFKVARANPGEPMMQESKPEQHHNDDWLLAAKDAISAQIDEGFEQAQRGESIDADDAVRILKDRRDKRKIV